MTSLTTRYFVGEHELSFTETHQLQKLFKRRNDLHSPCPPWQMPGKKMMREYAVWPHGPWSERRLARLLKEHADRELEAFKAKLIKVLQLEEKELEVLKCP